LVRDDVEYDGALFDRLYEPIHSLVPKSACPRMSRFPTRHDGHAFCIVRFKNSTLEESVHSGTDILKKIGRARGEPGTATCVERSAPNVYDRALLAVYYIVRELIAHKIFLFRKITLNLPDACAG
jgi:hypothetical protein